MQSTIAGSALDRARLIAALSSLTIGLNEVRLSE